MNAFTQGRAAALAGQPVTNNPYLTGETTKLGTPKMTDEGYDWLAGYKDATPRKTTKIEKEAAVALDVTRFRRKANRFYA